ncbi:hypothetical protein Ancab_018109 [Ancistrocladus abbreviatus]
MASVCRSAMVSATRSMVFRCKTHPLLKSPSAILLISSSPPYPSSTRAVSTASRLASMLGTVESLKPLHSTIASARLNSIVALDSTCWSWLSQGFALPL